MARRLLLTLVLALAACSEVDPPVDCTTDPSCVPGGDEILAGVNLTTLFEPPATDAEVAEARLRRDSSATPGTLTQATLATDPDGTQWVLLALESGGAAVVRALARIPGPVGANEPLRTLLLLPDGENEATEAVFLTAPGFRTLVNGTVQILVAYRGETLTFRGQPYASDLPADPYGADVNDALAVAALAGQVFRADAARLAAVGFGRGGTVALLAAQRSARFRAVVTFGAPTDLLAPSFRDETRIVLLGRAPTTPFPALSGLVAPVLALRDGEISEAEARVRLIARSPRYVVPDLPTTLLLHAVPDDTVPTEQGRRMAGVLAVDDGVSRTYREYDANHDSLRDLLSAQLAAESALVAAL